MRMLKNNFLAVSHRRPRRGMALYLVMVALVVCVLLGTVFLANSSVASVTGRNVEDRLKSRAIAESGIAMALRFIDLNPDWRTTQANGQWLSNYSLNGGTLTVSGEDGNTVDSSGNVVG